jgi:xanthine dehydrogenase accessory factor
MKELLDMIKMAKREPGPMVLATVIQTAGSSYRKAGARMLILSEGRTIGCLSGGCLDQDVVQRGLEVMKTQKPVLVTYDTSSDRDILLGSGVGCNGVVDIFLEFLPSRNSLDSSAPGLLDFIDHLMERRCVGAVATVTQTDGEIELALGDRVTLDERGSGATNMANPRSANILTRCVQSALTASHPEIIFYESRTGSARIFVETIFPQPKLVILGAGNDAMPLVRLANELGYRIAIVDGRPEYATRDRFPLADKRIIARPEEECHRQQFDKRTAAVIMSHNYLVDQAWLKNLLPLRLPYLGLMGPRKRGEKMLAELRRDGFKIAEMDLRSLHNPIGLDIGADAPEQIALAILAEIQATLTAHNGGKLTQKKGAIHLAPASEEFPCAVLA